MKTLATAICAVLAVSAPAAQAAPLFVTLDTSALVGHVAGPFTLAFQLTDGGGEAATTVTIGAFDFGGGTPEGLPRWVGGASGDLASSVVLSDTSFFNQVTQTFVAGNALSFAIEASPGVESSFPDLFTLSILDRVGVEIPTLGVFGTEFVSLEFTSTVPAPGLFASDPSQAPAAGGAPIVLPAPNVVPEPRAVALIGVIVAAVQTRRRRRRL